jgi:hypothetical protein
MPSATGSGNIRRAVVPQVDGAAVDQVVVDDVVHHRVELALDHHGAEVGLDRHRMHDDAGRRLEAGGAAMAVRGGPLHPPFHVLRSDAPLVLQRAARPQRRGLLILRHADALALEVGGRLDAGVAPHHRQPDEAVVAVRQRHHQRRHRHLADVEVAELELAPEDLRRMRRRDHEVDAVDRDAAVDDRPGARIGGEADAELQFRRHGHSAATASFAPAMPRYQS